jgi:putative FmdB family regulatory protein
MPIYAYRCDECGFSKDVLQKISDPVLTTCLSCGKPAFKKQVTAAGFQLKGTGWYVTDFRGGNAPKTGTAPARPSRACACCSRPRPTAARRHPGAGHPAEERTSAS